MKEIRIENLSKYHKDLLEEMWAIDAAEDFEAWYEEQDSETRQDIDDLVRLVLIETMDEEYLGDFEEAKSVISQFTLH